ncbi:hypothetical protein KVT40_003800 [Elsinoe batatas]|uniref:Mitochondrial import inner membrane translocase subunit Tim21 n=1 Tax=Elsinoe batatas TaxID=2601811 RepID=A0A8K0L2N7_9PEZI|nr:hypothetical protein KVT40_003800 [Elsinoe batatas]
MPPPRIRLLNTLPRSSSSLLLRSRPFPSTLTLFRPASDTSKPPPRKSITLTTDTGHIPWSSLSPVEKAARGTRQSFNFLLVLLGLSLTAGVSYVLYLEVFSPSSKTAVFNAVVKRIRSDPRCVDILGREIEAHGEGSWSRWARNRVVSSRTEMDRRGMEHMHMHFYVSGPKSEGTVWVHMVRQDGKWEEWYLALEPEGTGERVVLEDKRGRKEDGVKGGKMFGVRWW